MKYLKAEYLKFKRTILNRLLWIAPLMTAFLAWLMGGFYGFQYMTFYWWYTFLLPGTIAILCSLSHKAEERAGKYYSVFSMPLDLARFELAKAVVLIGKLLVAALILALLAAISMVVAPTLAVYSIMHCVLGSIGIVLASVWLIPICLYLARKCGMFFPVMVNFVFSLFSPIAVGNTAFWWLWPYCWAPKFAEAGLGIQINGTYADTSVSGGTLLLTLLLSVLLFGVLAYGDARNFSRQEGK